MGWEGRERERERAHHSAQCEQEEGETHSSRIRAQSAAQLESFIHLSTSLLEDLESSVFTFPRAAADKAPGMCQPYPEHSLTRLKAQESSPLPERSCTASPHMAQIRVSQLSMATAFS